MRKKMGIFAALLALTACSKSDSDPQIFVPRLLSPQGEDLSAAHSRACDPMKVSLTDNVLTNENFTAVFACANYDHSLNGLEPLFTSPDFPKLITSVNAVLKSDNTQTIKSILDGWLEDGPGGTSRVDRLLPFLSSLIKNPSFQDALPVVSNILQSGKLVWADLLPALADVVYTDLFPDNLENAFVIFNSFSTVRGSKESKDYATGIRRFANFMQAPVDGQTASLRALTLLDDIRALQPDGTSLYQFAERALEFGTIDEYFLNSGAVRGEQIDPKLNENPDDAATACPGLNDTADQRQQCAGIRLWRRGSDGSEAPITQLAGLVVELEKDHPELLSSLAKWFTSNGPRVEKALRGYVVRAKIVTSLGELNAGNFLQAFAAKSGLDPAAPVTSAQLATLITQAFASPDFAAFVAPIVQQINTEAFGADNAAFLTKSPIAASIVALYQAPELAAYSTQVIPGNGTASLTTAIRKFNNKHRTDALPVAFNGKTQSLEKHLGDVWAGAVESTLGDDVVMNYVVKLAQSLATDMAKDFTNKGQPFSEWYFNSPYGNPATTEMLVGYAIQELDLLSKYYKNKDWLMGQFTDEVFSNDDDKRAFRMLIAQVPDLVTYVRSGASRSGGDLSRAMAKDTDGYLVKTYVGLVVKATTTGWVSRAARLMEAYQAQPDYVRAAAEPMSDDIADRRDYKLGVEALVRIVRSLVQPETRDDYSTTTLSRLLVPLSSVVGEERRAETERLLITSAKQVSGLSDQQINDFMRDLSLAKPGGDPGARRESYKAVADVMRNPGCVDLVQHLSALFHENAVKPALDFFATRIDDGSLPKMLLFIRRLLGIGK